VEFYRIQDEAGVKRSDGNHFGFHDLRRGFASMNADRVSADVLQTIMRHKSYSTTQRYINLTRQLNPSTANLFVPELKKSKTDNAG
jgi:integrase